MATPLASSDEELTRLRTNPPPDTTDEEPTGQFGNVEGSGDDLDPDERLVYGQFGLTGVGTLDPTSWLDNVQTIIGTELVTFGDARGWPRDQMLQILDGNAEEFWQWMNNYLKEADDAVADAAPWVDAAGVPNNNRLRQGSEYLTTTTEGFTQLLNHARQFFNMRITGLDKWYQRGGMSTVNLNRDSGSRSLTPQEIRQKFDLDQLADRATALWRSYLLDEPTDARAMAKAYVDAVVDTKGEQVIDFDTFISKKVKDTTRYASVYRNKPESVGEQEYLQPYFQAASQVLRPENAAGAAIGGAQFGASAEAFGARLGRSNEVRTSAPFINSMEERMRSIGKVFRG